MSHKLMSSPADFQTPPLEYRSLAFWSWNDRLDPRELRRQLRRLKAGGWGGGFMHARGGLITPYLGEEWMEAIAACVKEARRIGLRVWLYDEDRWPSGYGGGLVALRSERYRQRALVRKTLPEPPLPCERLVFRNARHAFYEHVMPLGQENFNQAAYLDLLNPEAVRAFLDSTYRKYAERFGRDLGAVIPGIFMDEPNVVFHWYFPQPCVPWTENLPDLFKRQWGYDLRPRLPALFEETGDFRRVRYHFRRVVDERVVAAFNRPLYDWCSRHNLRLTGHMTNAGSLYSQVEWSGPIMPAQQYFHVPGVDMLGRKIDEVITLKECVSVARQTGRPRVLSELFGLTGQGATFEDRKWIGDWHLALGVNLFCQHLLNYSIRGGRKRDCPPNLFFHQPYWKDSKNLTDYFNRLCYVLSQGTPRVDILVIHPIESVWCEYQPHCEEYRFQHNHPSVKPLHLSIYRLSENLLALRRDFDYGSEPILAGQARVRKGTLRVGPMSYRLVILPSLITIRGSTLKLLGEFARQGGTVASVGAMPSLVDGEPSRKIDKLSKVTRSIDNTQEALARLLDQFLPATISLQGQGVAPSAIYLHARTLPGVRILFFANTSRKKDFNTRLMLRDVPRDFRLAEWDAVTGAVHELPAAWKQGTLAVPLRFAPAQSRLLVAAKFRSAGRVNRSDPPIPSGLTATAVIRGPWKIHRRGPNTLLLDHASCRTSADARWSEPQFVLDIQSRLVQREYRGPLGLAFEFETRALPRSAGTVNLVVEEARRHAVRVNGQPVRYSGKRNWLAPALLAADITALVHRGKNRIELHGEFSPPRLAMPAYMPRDPGMEIEAVYLTGDFGVFAEASATPPGRDPLHDFTGLPELALRRLKPGFTIAAEKQFIDGDLVLNGYPFFAGTVELSAAFQWAGEKRAVLRLPRLDACTARISVNGRKTGWLAWPPYELDISSAIRKGRNTLRIALTNTLRNLMGPHYHAARNELMGLHFLSTSEFVERVEQRITPPSTPPPDYPDGRRDYEVVSFGILNEVQIVRTQGSGVPFESTKHRKGSS